MSEAQLIENKTFIGMDFLTWLLAAGEARGGIFELPRNGSLTVVFDNKIALMLESEQVDYRGEITNLEGVRVGLKQGLKVRAGRLLLKKPDREWRFTFDGRLMQVKSLRLPSVRHEDPAELLFDRIDYITELSEILDELFLQFLTLRMSPQWESELSVIGDWLRWE